MRVHLLALPNCQTTAAYDLDGFCQRTILFAELLAQMGIETLLYASEENEAPCVEHIAVVSKAEQRQALGATPYQAWRQEAGDPLSVLFNARVSTHLRASKRPGDIMATIGGGSQRLVAESHPDVRCLEYSIGYSGVFASHRIFESHAWRHVVQGFSGIEGPRVFDDVIPPWFHAEAFPFRARPDDYVLFCGRLVHGKGITTACDAAQRAGVRLVVIGHGQPELVTYGECLGAVSTAERNRLLAGARAVLMPTQYVEPFGNVSAEAQLCGTPVISAEMGGFVESVEQGVSGYRCRTLGEYVQAIDLARDLDRAAIRLRAERLYGFPAAREAYRSYFDRLNDPDGWRSLAPTLPAREAVYA